MLSKTPQIIKPVQKNCRAVNALSRTNLLLQFCNSLSTCFFCCITLLASIIVSLFFMSSTLLIQQQICQTHHSSIFRYVPYVKFLLFCFFSDFPNSLRSFVLGS